MSEISRSLVIDGKRILPESLPPVLRVVECNAIAIDDLMICCTATLYHRHISLKVAWTCRTVDRKICPAALVTIRWGGTPLCENGVLHIGRLLLAEVPDERTNLFDTIAFGWPVDRALVERGRVLVNQLPRRFKQLFNALFWVDQRFLRYVSGPGSLDRTHTGLNGNLRHSLEVAERALYLADAQRPVFRPLIILGSLLHDAGKADRYQLHRTRPCFAETERGRLVGHRAILLDWLSEAVALTPIELPPPHERAPIDLLTSVNGTPEWTGIGEASSREALLVDRADRWSMQNDAFPHTSAREGGAAQPAVPRDQPCRI